MTIDVWMIIKNSLSPRLESNLTNKTEREKENIIEMFENHTHILAEFIQKEYLNSGVLSVGFFQGLHSLFYPPRYIIKAIGNDGVEVENLPGEWRRQLLSRYITDFSKNECIADDLNNIIQYFNSLRNIKGEDILRFYMEFGQVHPFGDSNGTISAILADVQCALYGYAPLSYLHIRFRDKRFLFHTIELYAQDSSMNGLARILGEIDRFHSMGGMV